SLKTSHYSVAEAKLAEFMKEHRERVSNSNGEVSAKMTFGEALEIHQRNQADDVTIKPTTRHYWNQIFVALLKSWPGLAEMEIRRISKTDCKKWARTFRKLAQTSCADWHSPAAGKVKPVKSHGAMWTLKLARLLCSATPKRPQRIGQCAGSR